MGLRSQFTQSSIEGRYLIEARPQFIAHENEALFVMDTGKPVTPEYLATRVRHHMAAAGIDKPGACHLFRHAMATHMLDNGADIRFIQAILGHASLTTIERYTHVAIAKLQEIHAATHPATLARTPPAERQNHARDALLAALDREADDEQAAPAQGGASSSAIRKPLVRLWKAAVGTTRSRRAALSTPI